MAPAPFHLVRPVAKGPVDIAPAGECPRPAEAPTPMDGGTRSPRRALHLVDRIGPDRRVHARRIGSQPPRRPARHPRRLPVAGILDSRGGVSGGGVELRHGNRPLGRWHLALDKSTDHPHSLGRSYRKFRPRAAGPIPSKPMGTRTRSTSAFCLQHEIIRNEPIVLEHGCRKPLV